MTSLSNSNFWKTLQDYYHHIGPKAWLDEVVPFQITNNVALAKAYTQLIIAQINDYHQQNKNENKNKNEPFYLMEIGAGSGRFGYYLLKTLCKALEIYNFPLNCITYVMTDITADNISFWEQHDKLKPYIKEGILDFAVFDATTDHQFTLKNSNKTIWTGSLSKPMFIIGNYLIDTLPHDAFQISNDKLYESDLIVTNKHKEISSKNIDDYFKNISFSFTHNEVDLAYYKDPIINKILQYYKENLTEASFLIPIGGIELLNQACKFTTSHTMFLFTDKGNADLQLFEDLSDPDIEFHGSMSMSVNFDALARYVKLNSGTSTLMPNKGADFQIAFFMMNPSFEIPHTTFAFNMALGLFREFDLFNLCYKNDELNEAFNSLEDLLAMLNLTECDPCIFYDYYPFILERLEKEDFTVEKKLTLTMCLERIWEYFFKLETSQDIPFAIGTLYYQLNEPKKALEFYKHSLELFGKQEETLYNIKLAEEELAEELVF